MFLLKNPPAVVVPADQQLGKYGMYSTTLIAEFLTGKRKRFIRIQRELEYIRGNGVRHVAGVNFECDGGSIPRAAWWLIGHPLDGAYVRSCVTHDLLCDAARKNLIIEVEPNVWRVATRAHADSVFLESLRCEGLPEWKARAMYSGVRIGAIWKRS